jgi:hypothetical protein
MKQGFLVKRLGVVTTGTTSTTVDSLSLDSLQDRVGGDLMTANLVTQSPRERNTARGIGRE